MAAMHVLLIAFVGAAGAAQVSPVQKVMALLDEEAVKTKAEMETLASEFKTFGETNERASTKKEYAIKASAESIVSLEAAIVDASSKVDQGEQKIVDLSSKIQATEAELSKAVALREKEHEDFLATEKELAESVESLRIGIEGIVSNSDVAVLAQLSPEAKHHLADRVSALTTALKRMAEASYLTHTTRAKVQAFLQSQEDSELSLSTKSPEADILNQVMEMTEKSLADARKSEQEAAFAAASVKQNLEFEIKILNEESAEAASAKHMAAEAKAQSEKELALEKKGHSDDEAYLADLKQETTVAAENFEAEYKDATGALGAISKAKSILEKKFASLVETGVTRRAGLRVATTWPISDESKTRALRAIQQLGRRFHNQALIALSYRAAADPFGKVRSMVEDMIAKLMQEAAEEATHEAFCGEEQSKSEKSRDQKQMSLDKTEARIEKAEASVAGLTEEVTTISEEVSALDAAMADATSIRAAEKKAFAASDLELSESVDACAAAGQALRDYYEGASLLQFGSSTRTKARGGDAIIQVLEFAEADFQKLMSDGRAAEAALAETFEEFSKASKQDKAVKEMEIKTKQGEVKSLNSALSNYGEDKAGVSAELDAVLSYLSELKPKCERVVPSYAEKKAAREAEIAGLKDALKLLA